MERRMASLLTRLRHARIQSGGDMICQALSGRDHLLTNEVKQGTWWESDLQGREKVRRH